MFKFEDVSYSYKNNPTSTDLVLENLSFEVGSGEIVALAGPSGGGKSTVLKLMSKLLLSTGGLVFAPEKLAYMTQESLLLPWRTVWQNILLPKEISNELGEENFEKARRALEFVGMGNNKGDFPESLSVGMRQRVALARLLVQDEDFFLLDEPFSAIDYEQRLRLGRKLRKYCKNTDKTVLLVTHDIEEAISLADRVMVLGDKRIIDNIEIDLAEEQREPVVIRSNLKFGEYFARIWELLK